MSTLLVVAGPPGSGKTTAVEAMSKSSAVYVERFDQNPHLSLLLASDPGFNGAANCDWFLSRAEEALREADPNGRFILDQDPRAIIDVYSVFYHDSQQLSGSDLATLAARLPGLEALMARWSSQRVVYLYASPSVLHQRLVRRWGATAPSSQWVDRMLSYFEGYREALCPEVAIDTDHLTPLDLIERMSGLHDAG